MDNGWAPQRGDTILGVPRIVLSVSYSRKRRLAILTLKKRLAIPSSATLHMVLSQALPDIFNDLLA